MSAASLWRRSEPLILASGSATRRAMLLAAGIPVDVVKPEVDERGIEAGLAGQGASAREVAQALAVAKAQAVSQERPGRLVLAADQTLACDGANFHKPADPAAAAAQLASLGGRTHHLHSAFALARDGEIVDDGVASASLVMRALSPDFIAAYCAAAGPAILQSVGAYQLEGLGAQLFESIEGDHFTILGLPLLAVLAALRRQGSLVS